MSTKLVLVFVALFAIQSTYSGKNKKSAFAALLLGQSDVYKPSQFLAYS